MNRRDLLKAIAGAAAATFLGGLQLTGTRSSVLTGCIIMGIDHANGPSHTAWTLMEKQDDGAWHAVEIER